MFGNAVYRFRNNKLKFLLDEVRSSKKCSPPSPWRSWQSPPASAAQVAAVVAPIAVQPISPEKANKDAMAQTNATRRWSTFYVLDTGTHHTSAPPFGHPHREGRTVPVKFVLPSDFFPQRVNLHSMVHLSDLLYWDSPVLFSWNVPFRNRRFPVRNTW